MLKLGVLVSGGGTNLQAIMDAIDSGVITNAEVGLVISNNPGAYALKRAESRGIPAKCISPKKFENREEFHKALLQELQENKVVEKLKKIIAEVLNVDEEEITMETTFVDDLGADSLDVFQIIMGLEEEFDIEIPNEEAEKIVTVGDAVEQIKNALNS